MSDVECPYCGRDVDICHDDGAGYDENNKEFQECEHCGKTFAFTTVIITSHEAFAAPCQNGGEHYLKEIHRFPKEFAVGKKRCEWCDEEIVVDKGASKKAIDEYRASHYPKNKG